MVVLTTYESDDAILEAITAGASGYLLKAAPEAEILAGVRSVAARRHASWRRPIAASLARGIRQQQATPRLSEREREVLGLVAEGLSNPEIGRAAAPRRGDGEDAPAARLREARRG